VSRRSPISPAASLTVRRQAICVALAMIALAAAMLCRAQDTDIANSVVLVASRELTDANFREAVVLITQPESGGGQLGVILNRPSGARLSQIFAGSRLDEASDAIYAGGPVQLNRVLFLVRGLGPQNAVRVLDDVYLSADRTLLESIVRGGTSVAGIRVFAGYAGWAPRQLQAEIEGGAWHMVRPEPDVLFSADPSSLWHQLISRIDSRAAGLQQRRLQARNHGISITPSTCVSASLGAARTGRCPSYAQLVYSLRIPSSLINAPSTLVSRRTVSPSAAAVLPTASIPASVMR
jgi:putative transcriptional regulator